MTDFIAYHNIDKMGGDFKPSRRFDFFSRKPETLLRSAIGNRVWTITGKRRKGQMVYRLAGVFTPSEVQWEEDLFRISGDGKPFNPPIDLSDLPWFVELFREQRNFSLGFNRIRAESIIEGLETLVNSQSVLPEGS